MPLVLDSTKSLSLDISEMEISHISVDTDNGSGDATYWKEYTAADGTNIRVEDNVLSFSGTDFDNLITRAQEINDSGKGVWDSIKQAMYEAIMDAEGVSGTIE